MGHVMRQSPGWPSLDDSPAADLYRSHAPVIFSYLRLHVPSYEDAEDLLVEVFLAAFEHGKVFELREREQIAWLQRVARNKMIDLYRRASHRQALDIEQVAELLYDDEKQGPERIVLRHEEYARLRASLKTLLAMQQEVLRLRFAEGLRSAEIATIVGRGDSAVRMMLSRALNMLRTIYEQR